MKIVLMLIALSCGLHFTTDTANAGTAWILYRHSSSGWHPGATVYNDKATCEAAAQELATRLNTYTGCALGEVAVNENLAPPRTPTSDQENRDARFRMHARECERRGVRVIPKPGSKVTIFGTAKQRFDFAECMAERGMPLE